GAPNVGEDTSGKYPVSITCQGKHLWEFVECRRHAGIPARDHACLGINGGNLVAGLPSHLVKVSAYINGVSLYEDRPNPGIGIWVPTRGLAGARVDRGQEVSGPRSHTPKVTSDVDGVAMHGN